MRRHKRPRRDRRARGRFERRSHSDRVLERVVNRVADAVLCAVDRLARRLGPA